MEAKTKIAIGTAAAFVAGAALSVPVQAEQPVPAAMSYADLLAPVPDAGARLRLADEQYTGQTARFEEVQYAPDHHHHHHHHNRRWYQQNGYYWNDGGWVLRPAHHHHHHHHHHDHN